MNKSTSTNRHDRYADYTDGDFDSALAWLTHEGTKPWMARLKHDGDTVRVDLRGVPALLRQLVVDEFDAIELMTREQVREVVDGTLEDRIRIVNQVLSEAGR